MIRNIILFFKEKDYRNLTISSFIVLLNGTFIFHFAEGWKWLDSLYFSVITLTTVGYGDLTPKTDLGKAFSIIYIITGIGIIFGFINAFYQHRITRIEKLKEMRDIKR